MVAQPLADLVHRPPRHLLHIERVRPQDALCGRNELFNGDVARRHALVAVELVQLDVDAHQVPALARDQHDAAITVGLDERLEPDVGEVRDREHVHHAPRLVGRITAQRASDGLAHHAAGAIAAYDVTGSEGFDFERTSGVLAFDASGDGMARRLVVSALQADQCPRVVRRQTRRRARHDVEVEVVDARLVEDDVGHV